MKLTLRAYQSEADFWRIRNFLRDIFLLNERLEYSWHVARLDYWRWHYILTCQETGPVDQVTTLWETESGQIAAVLHPICHDEIRLHIHPQFRSPELEDAIIAYAEKHHSDWTEGQKRILFLPVFENDAQRQKTVIQRGFEQRSGWGHHWRRDLDAPLPDGLVTPGYVIRSMGSESEHPARSWASWRAFHADEPDENYDGDYSWYGNIQSAPLYRRDLDIVAATSDGGIAAFCTIFYDDYTRSAVCVLVGTAAEHWRRGLGKAVIIEGMRRLQRLGCTRIFATAHDAAADALYHSVMQTQLLTDTWIKIWNPNESWKSFNQQGACHDNHISQLPPS